MVRGPSILLRVRDTPATDLVETLMSQMFRQAALEKFSSPERLDSLMQVTTTKGWIALIGLMVVIAGVLVWGVLGSAPDNVEGLGILLREGGIFDIEISGSGVIEEVLVAPGDTVQAGDAVARQSLPELDQQIEQVQTLIAELEDNRTRETALVEKNRDLVVQSMQEEIARLTQEAAAFRDQEQFLSRRLAAQRQAVDLGLITNDQAEATAQELSATQANIARNEAQIIQQEASQAASVNTAARETFGLDQRIAESRRQLANLQLQHDQHSVTRSLHSGRIVELLVDEGRIAVRGTPMATVELTGRDIEAMIFVPLQGSRVKQGMRVHLSPEGIAWEEYGYMLGTVQRVSDAPASTEVMDRLLHNDILAQQFSASGGAYLITVTPELDSSTATGFRWTSERGPDTQIGTGTLLTGTIRVADRRPIGLVIPALRRWAGF